MPNGLKPMSDKENRFWNTPFEITSICRADLQDKFPEAQIRSLDDADMRRIASKMSDDYCEQLYWGSMEIIVQFILDGK